MKIIEKIREFKCNVLDWHKPIKVITYDGISLVSQCEHCGRKILQDSQGNWFSI